MELKRKEFSELKQGSMRVTEYLNRFINMARYAPEEVSTDAKKQYRFINGLTDELQLYVGSNDYANFQKLVDKVLITESKLHDVECNKRKFAS
jgi:UDP-galactopyranose mutase